MVRATSPLVSFYADIQVFLQWGLLLPATPPLAEAPQKQQQKHCPTATRQTNHKLSRPVTGLWLRTGLRARLWLWRWPRLWPGRGLWLWLWPGFGIW
jgi:hypothetical protein